MEALNIAVASLEDAISQLIISSEAYYDSGDNYRGNIRCDAANDLSLKLISLKLSRDYIAIAFEK